MENVELIIETDWGLYVRMQNEEDINDLNFIRIIEPILIKCKKIGKKRIIIEMIKFKQNLSIMKLFQSVCATQHLIGIGAKLALIAPDVVEDEKSMFVENAGFNRSIFIQYFNDRKTAMEWILN